MTEFTRILCPVDFADASDHALDHAITIAGWYESHITALDVRACGGRRVPRSRA